MMKQKAFGRDAEGALSFYTNQKKLQKGLSLDGIELAYFDQHDFGESEEEITTTRLTGGLLLAL